MTRPRYYTEESLATSLACDFLRFLRASDIVRGNLRDPGGVVKENDCRRPIMRTAALFTVILTTLVFAADASAGCFATAGSTAPPATVGPGDTWTATVTVEQHGVRLIPDAKPTVTIISESGERTTFAAKPTDQVGIYAASVVFPTAGLWDYEVNDGFIDSAEGQTWDCSTTHTFAAVTIGAGGSSGPADGGIVPAAPGVEATASDGSSAGPVLVAALAAIVVALAVAGGIGLARRSSRRHAEA